CGLGQAAEREQGAAELLLGQTPEEKCLILGVVQAAAQLVRSGLGVVADAGVMAGGDFIGADLTGGGEELVELDRRVAQAARHGRAAGGVGGGEGAYYVLFEAILEVDDIVGDAQRLGHATGIVDIVERATAPASALAHAGRARQTALIPKLHGEADDVAPLGVQHGCDRRAVHPAGHGDGDHARRARVGAASGRTKRRWVWTSSGSMASKASTSSAVFWCPKLKRRLARARARG